MLTLEMADLESIAEELERRAVAELAHGAKQPKDLAAMDRSRQAGRALQNAARSCRFAYTLPLGPDEPPRKRSG